MSEKLHGRTEDELKSEIYEVVRRLSEDYGTLNYLNIEVSLEEVKHELPSIDEGTIIDLLNKLTFCDKKLVMIDNRYTYSYLPLKTNQSYKKKRHSRMNEKLYEKTEDEHKSEIYEVVKKLSADYTSQGYPNTEVTLEEVKKELPGIDRNTMIDLLDKLTFCDKKLVKIDMRCLYTYLPI